MLTRSTSHGLALGKPRPCATLPPQAAPLDPASSTELQRIKEDNWGIVAGYLPVRKGTKHFISIGVNVPAAKLWWGMC